MQIIVGLSRFFGDQPEKAIELHGSGCKTRHQRINSGNDVSNNNVADGNNKNQNDNNNDDDINNQQLRTTCYGNSVLLFAHRFMPLFACDDEF